ncbi:MAG: MBL fold metallo-hydrolase [Treponema sp.]|jgi:phosphoribosyl 1,2-cyclic phosphodiesterase|nr:MBL fold metallo-hydrolase [Treponema sp.]
MLSVNFWGVRGSIPCPGRATVEYGGNTACLEIRAGERLVIVDMGTGVKSLGDMLIKNDLKKHPLDTDIFITHTHWDHIMGFPMFAPLFVPSTRLRIRGPVTYEDESLEAIIGAQLSYRYWPVRQSELAARIEYGALKETVLDLGGGLSVTTKYLNHPILCLGYRFEYQGKSIVTAYDHEPFRNLFPTDPADPGYDEDAATEGELAVAEENEKHFRFFQNADVLIHDSQYTAAEFEKHLGWGHSSFEYCIDAAEKTGVKKLVLFHHDPNRSDTELTRLEEQYRSKSKPGMEIMMAREGLTVEA